MNSALDDIAEIIDAIEEHADSVDHMFGPVIDALLREIRQICENEDSSQEHAPEHGTPTPTSSVIMPRVLIESQTKDAEYYVRVGDAAFTFRRSNPGPGGWVTLMHCRLASGGDSISPTLEINLRDIVTLARKGD